MNNPLVVGYRHTGIIVEDMAESLYFYKDILGLQVLQDYSDDSAYINKIHGMTNANVHMIKLKAEDGTIIEILKYINHQTKIIDQPIYNAGAVHVAFRIKDASKTYKILKNKGVRIISKPVLSSEKIAKVFFCFDPNNVRIELVEMLNKEL